MSVIRFGEQGLRDSVGGIERVKRLIEIARVKRMKREMGDDVGSHQSANSHIRVSPSVS